MPERALQRISCDEIGVGGAAHPSAVVGQATHLAQLATPGLLVLLEVCCATEPQAAVQALRARDWLPGLTLEHDTAASSLLLAWARQQQRETIQWLELRAPNPPPSLPAHRHADAVQLANEADACLRRAIELLEAAADARRKARRKDATRDAADDTRLQERVAAAVAASRADGRGLSAQSGTNTNNEIN